MNVQLPKGHRIKDIKKLGTFHWERVPKPAQSLEEMKAVMKALAKGFKKKKDSKTKPKKNATRRRIVRR